MADQQKIKKIEAVLKDNTYKAEDRIRELQDALEAQRRKSMADEDKIRDLKKALDKKYKEAEDNYNKYLGMQRVSDLTAD